MSTAGGLNKVHFEYTYITLNHAFHTGLSNTYVTFESVLHVNIHSRRIIQLHFEYTYITPFNTELSTTYVNI